MTEEILYKYISEQADTEESILVKQWVGNSEERKGELSRLKNIWILSGLDNEIDPAIKASETERIWSMIKKLNVDARRKSLRLQFLKYAAAIVLIIGISGTIGFFVSTSVWNSNTKFTEINVPKGERSSVVLPDGSTVRINSNSQLKFSSTFNSGKRKVILSGEAYFDVAHDKSHPFIVETQSLQIEVLGTRFNISSYPNDHLTTTFLESGKVKISSVGNDNVILNPNEAFEFNKISLESRKIVMNDNRMMDWTKGVMTINGETIGELAKKIERRFNVTVTFMDEAVKEHVYTGSIKDEDLNIVLEAIKFASSIEYKREGNQIILSSSE
jgi:ferric-dicitrate binding protein FerR (iron transport regulator)